MRDFFRPPRLLSHTLHVSRVAYAAVLPEEEEHLDSLTVGEIAGLFEYALYAHEVSCHLTDLKVIE